MWFLKATTCFAPATELALTSVAAKEVLNIVGALAWSTTIILSLPSKLYFSKLYRAALVRPVSLAVQVSDITSVTAWLAAVVPPVALVTPVNEVAVTPVYVNI